MPDLLEKVQDRIQACDCAGDEGCVRCIADPQRESSSSKRGSLLVLRRLLEVLHRECPATKDFSDSCPEFSNNRAAKVVCNGCMTQVSAEVNFCPNCGNRVREPDYANA